VFAVDEETLCDCTFARSRKTARTRRPGLGERSEMIAGRQQAPNDFGDKKLEAFTLLSPQSDFERWPEPGLE